VLDPSALLISGPDAIVDHVLLEVRDAIDPSIILHTRYCFLQRDGDVVPSPPGTTCALNVPPGNYYVAIRHRNHLAVMTANAIALGSTDVLVDLTSPNTATYGTSATKPLNGVQVLRAGNTLRDAALQYTGTGNDRDPILLQVGATSPNNVPIGYAVTDVTMDGVTKYTGARNDRDPLLVNVGSATPNSVRMEQLP
jgi:hypothetical protein